MLNQNDILVNKKYLIISKWAYPFGGGEEFLFQTMTWAKDLGMLCFWICFTDAKNKNYESLKIENESFGYIIKVPGGIKNKTIKNWIKLINPDIIHHQGHERLFFYEETKQFRIPFLSGIHFWSGIIELHPTYLNANMIEHAEHHKTCDDFSYLTKEKLCDLYCASIFVRECVKKITNIDVSDIICAASSIKKCQIKNFNPLYNKYVTIINIHKLKGGELILYLLNKMLNIPFLVVRTEYESEELDTKIKNIIDKRNNDEQHSNCIYMGRVSDPTVIYKKTRIFLAPSLCDETFCRTVNESMMNGIPVITTGAGNIKYLVGKAGYVIPISEKDKWCSIINELYNNPELYKTTSKNILKQYEQHSEQMAAKQFATVVRKTIVKSKDRNIMIFSPWCDQGLGIQSRNYYNILKSYDYNIYIFALNPYNGSTLEMQKNPEEWKVENIYYSPNNREKVTDIELIEFINKYNIGKCLLPETCWFRVFEVARLLRNHYVKCYAIPNIEIVRRDEIYKHTYFHKILCNNYLCQNIFNEHGNYNTEYIGYGMPNSNIFMKTKKIENNFVKFLFIGGMNAFSRKHILNICKSFATAYEQNKNMQLTCTIQRTNLLEVDDVDKINNYKDHPGINVIDKHITYKDILNLYYDNHVSIQVSKHEGLGIGFYESIYTGTPIITLNTAPHNEIVLDNINGWIIPCYYKPMTDNKDPIFDSAYFNHTVLSKKILHICSNTENIYNIIDNLKNDFNKRLNYNNFAERFIKSIND